MTCARDTDDAFRLKSRRVSLDLRLSVLRRAAEVTVASELVARGDLVHVRLGRRIVVPRHALERLLDVGAERPAAS